MEKRKIKYQGVSTLEVLIGAKNYNQWIADEIKKQITSPSLEIGAGTGNLTDYFVDSNAFYITETDDGLVKYLKEKYKSNKQLFISKLDISKKPTKQLTSFFSTVFAVNVLEHIQDDIGALRNIFTMLRSGGKLILLVPAKQFAYTKLDKELGHYRRYEKDELISKLTGCGYQIEKIYFFNFVGLIGWTVRDRVSRTKTQLKPYQIKVFDFLVPVIRKIESHIPMPVGISLIVIARKI